MKRKLQQITARLALVIFAIVLAISIIPGGAQAQGLKPDKPPKDELTVGIFSPTLTTLVADAQGFLKAERITVEYAQVSSSTQQFQSLRDGQYDLILTAPDNVAHYRLNESNALGGTFDVQAVAGTNRGQNLALVVRPDIKSFEDLRGKTLAVDSPNSGFAYVLYQMMRNHGLELNRDYQIVAAGGNVSRYEALLAGQFDGTLLLSGFELRAQAAGMTILERSVETIPGYLGGVVAGREAWLKKNRNDVKRLLRAYQRANEWIFNPANRDEAVKLLMGPTVDQPLAEKMYEVQVDPAVGLIRSQEIVKAELRTVLELRQEWGGFDQPQNLDFLISRASGLYDTSYLKKR